MIQKMNWSLSESTDRLPAHVDEIEQQFQSLKATIHQQLVESLDLSRLGEADQQRLTPQVRALADRVCQTRKELLGKIDRERLLDELLAEGDAKKASGDYEDAVAKYKDAVAKADGA